MKATHTVSLGDLRQVFKKSNHAIAFDVRLTIFQDLLEQYKQTPTFNVYEDMINGFFTGGYHLGKTSLSIDAHFPMAVRIMDVLTEFEKPFTHEIPKEHGKYLIAFIKEFVMYLDVLLKSDSVAREQVEPLLHQLNILRELVMRVKENGDIRTILDTLIHNFESRKQLLLEISGDDEEKSEPEYGTLALETALSKLTKTAYLGVLRHVYLYQEKDFHKIVERGMKQYGDSIFREAKLNLFPMYQTLLRNGYKNLTSSFAISEFASFIGGLSKEEIKELIYYPLPCDSLDGLYDIYVTFLEGLVQKGTISDLEKDVFRYEFLQQSYRNSDYLCGDFVRMTQDIARDVLKRINVEPFREILTLDDLTKSTFEYQVKDELFFLDNSSGMSLASNAMSISLNIEDGEPILFWRNHTKRVDDPHNSFSRITVPRPPLVCSKLEVLDVVHVMLLHPLYDLHALDDVELDEDILQWINNFEEHLGKIKITELSKRVVDFDAPYDIRKRVSIPYESIFLRIMRQRIKGSLLNISELKEIFRDKEILSYFPFKKLGKPQTLKMIDLAIKKGVIDLATDEGIKTLFYVWMEDRNSFMYEKLREHYNPEMVSYLSNLVDQGKLEHYGDNQEREKRKKAFVCSFFEEKLIGKNILNMSML